MLKTVLRLNAASCLGFGVLFLAAPGAVRAVLGSAPALVIAAIGAVLVLNGAHLMLASSRPARPAELRYFAAGDVAWVAGTLGLAASGLWITEPGGIAATVAVAAMVGCFGLLQWRLAAEVAA